MKKIFLFAGTIIFTFFISNFSIALSENLGIKNAESNPINNNLTSNESIKGISSNGNHSMLVLSGDTTDSVYTWGSDQVGEVGNGSTIGNVIEPTEIYLPFEGTIDFIATSEINSGLIVTIDNVQYIYIWGDNSYGQVGDGTVDGIYDEPSTSIAIPENYSVVDFEMGYGFVGLILHDNDTNIDNLYTWGNNTSNELGRIDYSENYYSTLNFSDPTLTTNDLNITNSFEGSPAFIDLVLGENNGALQISDDSKDQLYVWGDNSNSELGIDNSDFSKNIIDSPSLVIDTSISGTIFENKRLSDFSIGKNHSGFVLTNETYSDEVYMLGSNSNGQLGVGESSTIDFAKPVKIELDPSIITVSNLELANSQSAFVASDGLNDYLYMAGKNDFGQLGLGTTPNNKKSTFTRVELNENTNISYLSLGYNNTEIVTSDSSNVQSIYSWGSNNLWQLGTEENIEKQFYPIQIYILSNSLYPNYIDNSFTINSTNYDTQSFIFSFDLNTYSDNVFYRNSYSIIENNYNVQIELFDNEENSSSVYNVNYLSTINNIGDSTTFTYEVKNLQNHNYVVENIIINYDEFGNTYTKDLSSENNNVMLSAKNPTIENNGINLINKTKKTFDFQVTYYFDSSTNINILENHNINVIMSEELINSRNDINTSETYFFEAKYVSQEQIDDNSIVVNYRVENVNPNLFYIYGLDLNFSNDINDYYIFENDYAMYMEKSMLSGPWIDLLLVVIIFILTLILSIVYYVSKSYKRQIRDIYNKSWEKQL